MGTIELRPDEQMLQLGALGRVRARINLVPGAGIVTNQRFLRLSVGKPLAVPRLVQNIQTHAADLGDVTLIGARVDIDLPLDAITSLSQGTWGRNQSVLEVVTADDKKYRLVTNGLAPWLQAFGRAMATSGTTKLVQQEAGTWTVSRP